jgi:hypothetical protein
VEYSGRFLETSEVFRRWTAISAIAAALERRVWLDTGSRLFPNLYVMIIGPSGIGKTRVIDVMLDIVRTIPEFYISPTSMKTASLVDCLYESKRKLPFVGQENEFVEYNSMYVAVDELSAFMHQYDYELVAALTKFYDCNWYKQVRRTSHLSITIDRPQLNLICGSTPTNLMELMPAFAWTQGLTGRTIFVYDTRKEHKDILKLNNYSAPIDLAHDILVISKLFGAIDWNTEYAHEMSVWRLGNKEPEPKHPNLVDYNSRRETHILKLSMISAVDRGSMTLSRQDFSRAMSWLIEIELTMPAMFEAGMVTADGKALDNVVAWMADKGGVSHTQLIRQVSKMVPTYAVAGTIEILKMSGRMGTKDGKWVANE